MKSKKSIAAIWKSAKVTPYYAGVSIVKPSDGLKSALRLTRVRNSMCGAIRQATGYTGLYFYQRIDLFTRRMYLLKNWYVPEVWRRWWNDDPYWDSASYEASERRVAFIKHLIKKLEKHGL